MLPNFKYRKKDGGHQAFALVGKSEGTWEPLCHLTGRRGQWTIVEDLSMGSFSRRWEAAIAYADRFLMAPLLEQNREILRWWRIQPFKIEIETLSEDTANQIYDILVDECGAYAHQRKTFVEAHAKNACDEFRIGGFSFGTKFRSHGGWWVDCYPEDQNYRSVGCILHINQRLKELWEIQEPL